MGSATAFDTEEDEHCLRCGKQVGLQGVAVTVGQRTFHLFYLCNECATVDKEELLETISRYRGKGT